MEEVIVAAVDADAEDGAVVGAAAPIGHAVQLVAGEQQLAQGVVAVGRAADERMEDGKIRAVGVHAEHRAGERRAAAGGHTIKHRAVCDHGAERRVAVGGAQGEEVENGVTGAVGRDFVDDACIADSACGGHAVNGRAGHGRGAVNRVLAPATLQVTSGLDNLTTPGTLRYAVAHAVNGDKIVLKSDVTLTLGEVLLTQQNLTIDTKAGPVTISGDNLSRIFEVTAGASVTLHNLILTDGTGMPDNLTGMHAGRGGAIAVDAGAAAMITDSTLTANSVTFNGGGIVDYGTVTVDNSTVSDNNAIHFGGGIYNFGGTLTVNHSVVSGNTVAGYGGGIYNYAASTATINGSTVSGNSAGINGGGIANDGTATVSGGDLSGNSATFYGGGIANFATMTVSARIFGNVAQFGGGVENIATLTVGDSKLSNNTGTTFGGGIFNLATATVNNSILSGNVASGSAVGGGGGGIYNSFGSTLAITNSTLSGNSSPNWVGGGIYNGGSLTIAQSTLSRNGGSRRLLGSGPRLAARFRPVGRAGC